MQLLSLQFSQYIVNTHQNWEHRRPSLKLGVLELHLMRIVIYCFSLWISTGTTCDATKKWTGQAKGAIRRPFSRRRRSSSSEDIPRTNLCFYLWPILLHTPATTRRPCRPQQVSSAASNISPITSAEFMPVTCSTCVNTYRTTQLASTPMLLYHAL